MPVELAYVWDWYWQLCSGEPMAYVEIEAWARLTGISPMPWEVRLLKSIDRKRQQVINE